jgi:DnaJ family protein C protein 13
MLRAQCILFRRYASVLSPYKYAGYPQLLEVLRQQQVAAGSNATSAAAAAAADVSSPASVAGQADGKAGPPGPTQQQQQQEQQQQGGGGGGAVTGVSSSSSSGHFLSGERISQVLAAIELCWLTCVASRRNAEELLRSGGLPLLAGLLTR